DVLGNRDLADTVRTQLYKEQTAPLMEEIDRQIAEIEALEEVDPDRFRAYAKVLNTLREIRAEIVGEIERLEGISDPIIRARLDQEITTGKKTIEKEIAR